jgi:hypothetical protein
MGEFGCWNDLGRSAGGDLPGNEFVGVDLDVEDFVEHGRDA